MHILAKAMALLVACGRSVVRIPIATVLSCITGTDSAIAKRLATSINVNFNKKNERPVLQ